MKRKLVALLLCVAIACPAAVLLQRKEIVRAAESIADVSTNDPDEISIEIPDYDEAMDAGNSIDVSAGFAGYSVMTDEMIRKIYEAAEAYQTYADLSSFNIPVSQMQDVAEDLAKVSQYEPELFYIGFNSVSGTGTIVTKVEFSQVFTQEQLVTVKQQIASVTASAFANVDLNEDDYLIALQLHDWLADHVNYIEYEHAHDMYGALVLGEAVCEGYAKAYKYLCSKAGIECYYVSSRTLNHGWNVINIGGKYYNVDVTWDDPTCKNGIYDMFGKVNHNYFLVDNETMLTAAGRYHNPADNFDPSYLTDKSFVDAEWREINTILSYYNGAWYYATWYNWTISAIMRTTDPRTSEGTCIAEIPNSVWSTARGYFPDTYSHPELYSHYLIFNTRQSIDYIDLDDPTYTECMMYDYTELEDVDLSNYKWIYGFTVDGAVLRYEVDDTAILEAPAVHTIANKLWKEDTPTPGPDPVNPDPVNPDPVNPDPVNPDPVNPDPVNPDPVNPDPVNPDPVNPDPVNPDPTNPDPNPTYPDPVKEPTFEDFIERMYVVALNRKSEPDGKAFWMYKVKNEGFTGGRVAIGFLIGAPEFLNRGLSDSDFVDVLYKTFFDREADEGGKAFWMGHLASDMTREQVVRGFIDSTEWCNLCAYYGVKSGAPNAKAEKASSNALKFATRLYTECLGRTPDEGGLQFWALRLTNLESSGYEAARDFFESKEFTNKNVDDATYVKLLYRTFMGRDYDQGGLEFWLGHLSTDMTRVQVLQGFAQSQEFTNICNEYGIDRGTI